MEAIDILKNLVAKFKDLKQADENYRTYRDTVLADCFKEAEAFLSKQDPAPVSEVKPEEITPAQEAVSPEPVKEEVKLDDFKSASETLPQ